MSKEEFGKIKLVISKGPQVTKENNLSQNVKIDVVNVCSVCTKNPGKFSCSQCLSGCYCSNQCKKKDWKFHKSLCKVISKLDLENRQKDFDVTQFSGNSSLTPKQKLKLVKLVGQKCTINCSLDGVQTEALWDTGAEVTVVGKQWLQENFPEIEIKDVAGILGQDLFLKVANNSTMEHMGYVEMVLLMSELAKPILVPFLVIEDVTMPIIGYNVIEEVVKEELSRNNAEVNEVLSSAMKSINKRQIDGIINLIQKKIDDPEPEYIGIVKTGNKDEKGCSWY